MRDFRILWICQTVSEVGTRISTFVFPLIGYALTGSIALAALVEAAALLGTVAMLLPAGVLADRVDRLLLLRLASATGAVAYGSLGIVAALGELTFPHLVIAALVAGLAAGTFPPAEMSAITAIVPPDAVPTALSQNQARQHVAGLLGAPIGGLLYGLARWLPFAADAATYAFSWAALGRIRTDLAPKPGEPTPALAALREGLGFVARHPLLRLLAGWACLTNLCINALFMLAVLRMVRDDVTPFQIGLVETAAALAGIVGAVIAPWMIARIPTGWLTILIAWSPLPLAVPMALSSSPAMVAAALSLMLLVGPAGNAGIMSYVVTITPSELLGRTQSSIQFVVMASLPAAPVVAGALLGWLDGREAMLAAGALCGVAALIPTASPLVRAVPRPDAWPSQPTMPSRT